MSAVAVARAVPWRPSQLRTMLAGQVVAVVLVAFAAYKTARTGSVADQADWLAVGVAGLAAAAIVSAGWLLTAKRRVVGRRQRLTVSVGEAFAPVAQEPAGTDHFAPVAGTAMSHYHLPGCLLVRGKDVAPASVIEHHRAKRTPCAVCRP